MVGQRYGTIFQMVPDPANRKLFQLQVAEQMSDYLVNGAVSNALNMPSITAEEAVPA